LILVAIIEGAVVVRIIIIDVDVGRYFVPFIMMIGTTTEVSR